MRLTQPILFPATFLLLAILPTALLDRLPAVCMYRTLFGFRCLGCGMTHAFSSILHGEWAAAWAYNPLVVIAFPLLAAVAIRNARDLFRQLYLWFHRYRGRPAYRTATVGERLPKPVLALPAGSGSDAQTPHCVAFQPHQQLYKPF